MAFHFFLHLFPVFFLLLHKIFDLILLFLIDKNQGNLRDFLTLLVYLLGVLFKDQQFIAEITATFPDVSNEVLQDSLTAPFRFTRTPTCSQSRTTHFQSCTLLWQPRISLSRPLCFKSDLV